MFGTIGFMKNKIQKNALIQILMRDFRTSGFDGLSLAQISDSTSLGKASLYHHFPGGKEEMALEVMRAALNWINTEIAYVLNLKDDPSSRLKTVLEKLNGFYECGERACILEAMVASDVPVSVKDQVKDAFETLMDGFRKLALDFGFTRKDSVRLAELTVISLQGSLIVSRGARDKTIFQRALKNIEDFYTTKT